MRLSTKTNLAVRILMFCALNPDQKIRKLQVARYCNASVSLVSVVIQQLGIAGFLKTTRGRGGGIRLNTHPDNISVGAVFREFEKQTGFAEWFDATRNTEPLVEHCSLRPVLGEALAAFYSVLDSTSLSDLVTGNVSLSTVLSLPNTKSHS